MVQPAALESGWQTRDVCDRFGSGAYLMETLPCVLFILERHGGSLEEAIVRGVNGTKDNDTVAAIVGAAMGALHGRTAMPERWLAGLTGRTRHRSEPMDDGRVFELIEEALGRSGCYDTWDMVRAAGATPYGRSAEPA